MSIQNELDRSRRLGEQLEHLVVQRGQCSDEDRNILLLGYWALLFDFHKAILSLIAGGFCGGAFALVRPTMEAIVRAHVAVKGSEADVKRLRCDEYRTDFATIGPWIDSEFGTAPLFTNLLRNARFALHSFTHAGVSQLGRRFDGHDVKPTYREGEIIEVIHTSTSVSWMITNLVTKYLGFVDEAAEAEKLYVEWGKSGETDPA